MMSNVSPLDELRQLHHVLEPNAAITHSTGEEEPVQRIQSLRSLVGFISFLSSSRIIITRQLRVQKTSMSSFPRVPLTSSPYLSTPNGISFAGDTHHTYGLVFSSFHLHLKLRRFFRACKNKRAREYQSYALEKHARAGWRSRRRRYPCRDARIVFFDTALGVSRKPWW